MFRLEQFLHQDDQGVSMMDISMMDMAPLDNRQTSRCWLSLKSCWMVAALTIGLVAAGCSQSSPENKKTEPQDQTGQTDTDQVASMELDSRLFGVWLGRPTLDRKKVESRLADLDPSQREGIEQRVESFMTTLMAMEFTERGTVENDVEMQIDGKTVRETSVGKWRVTGRTEDSIDIVVEETLRDGTQITTRKTVWLDSSGNQIRFDVPLGEPLESVDSGLIFERKSLDHVAEAPGRSSNR